MLSTGRLSGDRSKVGCDFTQSVMVSFCSELILARELLTFVRSDSIFIIIIIIIMCIHQALNNALSVHVLGLYTNLNMKFSTHVQHRPVTKICIKYYTETLLNTKCAIYNGVYSS